jgi:multidrug efflux pump
VVGLLPLMFQLHPNFRNGVLEYRAPGSEWWVQLSAAVVWGLGFATLLTLLLTPVLLAAPKVMAARFHRVFEGARGLAGLRRKDSSRPAVADGDIPRAAE